MGVTAWHFLLRRRDGVPVIMDGAPAPLDGSWATVDPPLELCRKGLHASEDIVDAMMYAPDEMPHEVASASSPPPPINVDDYIEPVLCRVELSGEVLRGTDKVCAQHRRVLWCADPSRVLRLWAFHTVADSLRNHGIDDERVWDALHENHGDVVEAAEDICERRRRVGMDGDDGVWRLIHQVGTLSRGMWAPRTAHEIIGDKDDAVDILRNRDVMSHDITSIAMARARELGLSTEGSAGQYGCYTVSDGFCQFTVVARDESEAKRKAVGHPGLGRGLYLDVWGGEWWYGYDAVTDFDIRHAMWPALEGWEDVTTGECLSESVMVL